MIQEYLNSKEALLITILSVAVICCMCYTCCRKIERYGTAWFPKIYLKDIRLSITPTEQYTNSETQLEDPKFQTFEQLQTFDDLDLNTEIPNLSNISTVPILQTTHNRWQPTNDSSSSSNVMFRGGNTSSYTKDDFDPMV